MILFERMGIYMIAQNFIVKGSVIIKRCKTCIGITLWTDDWDKGTIQVNPEEIDPNKYYEFSNNMGKVELEEINFVDSDEELNNWI
jgi:hypothetical protein